MQTATDRHEGLRLAMRDTARMMIALYLLARTFGLAGASPGDAMLAGPVLAEGLLGGAAQAVLALMSLALLLGVQARLAALMMGIYLFWSSFIVNFAAGNPPLLDAFWRDLTLTAALALVAAEARATDRAALRLLRSRVRPRRIKPAHPAATPRPRLRRLPAFGEGQPT